MCSYPRACVCMCRVAVVGSVAIHLAASGSAQLARGATEPAVFGDTHRAHAQTQFVRNIIFAAVRSLSLANKRHRVSQGCRDRGGGGWGRLCCWVCSTAVRFALAPYWMSMRWF